MLVSCLALELPWKCIAKLFIPCHHVLENICVAGKVCENELLHSTPVKSMGNVL